MFKVYRFIAFIGLIIIKFTNKIKPELIISSPKNAVNNVLFLSLKQTMQ